MADLLSVRFDTSGLVQMLHVGRAYSRRTPAVAITTAAYVVATFAYSKMPVVEIPRMDAELQVTTAPARRTKSGRISKATRAVTMN